MPGPALRTDIVEVYVFRRGPAEGPARAAGAALEFLQLHRVAGPLAGTWQPVMGHVEPGETALAAARRELAEETGYGVEGPAPDGARALRGIRGLRGLWQLELVNTFYLACHDCIMMSPGFAAEVEPGCDPHLDASHDRFRWVRRDQVDGCFLWPGQRAALAHIVRDILAPDAAAAEHLRIDFDS